MEQLAKALNEFQKELVQAKKKADNPFFKSKYAPLDEIMKEAQPVLTKHGLSVMQLPDNIDGKPALTTVIMHVSGESQRATVPLILAKDDPQGVGSAITYMRRYSYAAALQIVIDEDDDGNKASQPHTQKLNGFASDSQRKLIKDKLAQKGVSDEEIPGWLAENYGVSGKLMKQDASMIIDDLISDKKEVSHAL